MCPENADTTAAAKEACDGKQTCNYHGDNSQVGDPCQYISKYTELYWKCVDPKAETMCAYIATSGTEKNWKTA